MSTQVVFERYGRLLGLSAAFFLGVVLDLQAATFTCSDVPCLLDAVQQANANGEDNRLLLAAGTYVLPGPDDPAVDTALPVFTGHMTVRGERQRRPSSPASCRMPVSAGPYRGVWRRAVPAPHAPGREWFGRPVRCSMMGRVTLRHVHIGTMGPGFCGGGGGVVNRGMLDIRHSDITTITPGMLARWRGTGEWGNGILTVSDTLIGSNRIRRHRGRVRGQWPRDLDAGDGDGGISPKTTPEALATAELFSTAPGGILIIRDSSIVENRSVFGDGAGILNSGYLEVTNTTFGANVSPDTRPVLARECPLQYRHGLPDEQHHYGPYQCWGGSLRRPR